MGAWSPEALISRFMRGLHDPEVRRDTLMHHFEEKTLESVRDYAIELTGRQRVADAKNRRRDHSPRAKRQASGTSSNWKGKRLRRLG